MDDTSTSPMPMPDLQQFMTPALIGAYAVAGVLAGRAIRGTQTTDMNQLLLIFASSSASAYLAPMAVPYVICPKADSAPLVEAVISSAISWEAIMLASGSQNATMFAPVQLVAHVAGVWMASKYKSMKKEPDVTPEKATDAW